MVDWFVSNPVDFSSATVVASADSVQTAAKRNLIKQKELLDAPDRAVRFRKLLEQMPRGEAGGSDEVAFKTVKSLCNLHRGELREWEGRWRLRHGPAPIEAEEPGLWQAQFWPPEQQGAVSTVLHKLAICSIYEGHMIRVSHIFGLADLFHDFGMVYTAADLYKLYKSSRIFAHVRQRTVPKSRTGHWQSKQGRQRGHWQMGHWESEQTGHQTSHWPSQEQESRQTGHWQSEQIGHQTSHWPSQEQETGHADGDFGHWQ